MNRRRGAPARPPTDAGRPKWIAAALLVALCGLCLLAEATLRSSGVGASPTPVTAAGRPGIPPSPSSPTGPGKSPDAAPSTPAASGAAGPAPLLRFSGDAAFAHVRSLVDLGPRPVGSEAHVRAEHYIVEHLRALGLPVECQRFLASTPRGRLPMVNILARVGGTDPDVVPAKAPFIIAASHYDTKSIGGVSFVGANDGGSSTGTLLELARALSSAPPHVPVILAFFDGEEAFETWSDTDSLYGSRHLAAALSRRGRLKDVVAFVLLDMIGDRDLKVQVDARGSGLDVRVWAAAERLGYAAQFPMERGFLIEDDHLPFARAGVPCVDLIDFQYGPGGTNGWWHTAEDTLDKLSPASLHAVGRVTEAVLRDLSPLPERP